MSKQSQEQAGTKEDTVMTKEYIEIKLPRLLSWQKNPLSEVITDKTYMPIFVVMLFVIAYLLGVLSARMLPTV